MATIHPKTLTACLAAALALVVMGLVPVMMRGENLTGRFFAEKQSYLVGEPVFIDFEITNQGTEDGWVDEHLGAPCIQLDTVKVIGAKYHGFGFESSFGCFGGVAGSCFSNVLELKPGERHTERIFLSALYLMDHAGVYDVVARRQVPVYPSPTPILIPPIPTQEFSSNFQITLIQGSEEELRAAYQQYVQDASNLQSPSQWQAIWAINEMAPPFLEDFILKLADTPNRADPKALRRLNTARSKQKLADLAEHSPHDWIRQRAIQQLAKTLDQTFLPVLMRIGRQSTGGERDAAILGAGLLGGEGALPFLTSMLGSADVYARVAAVRGLGLTASRQAVKVLVAALQDRDTQVFQAATQSLAELTHFSITPSPWTETPSTDEFVRWNAWWSKHGATTPIYNTDTCAEPKLLGAD